MNALAHLSTDIFPILILILIYLNNKRRATCKSDQYWFKLLNMSMIAYFAVDIFYWGIGEKYFQSVKVYIWGINILYQILEGAIACFWFNYVYCRLYAGNIAGRIVRNIRIIEAVYGIYVLIAVTSPWTKLMFDVSSEGQLIYGPLYYLQYAAGIAVTMGSAVLVGYRWYYADLKEMKEKCKNLMLFNLITFSGVFIQFVRRDIWIAESCMAVSILVVYIAEQNRDITTDGLTGLNNRQEFDQYIYRKAEETDGDNWGMLMIDLDEFKTINDNYGHAVGDEVLWRTADILKNIAGIDSNFLARYGGDEFVVVGNWKNKKEVEEMIRALEQEAENDNAIYKKEISCRLSFSIGYALWSENEKGSVEELIRIADERMYEMKKKKKGIC